MDTTQDSQSAPPSNGGGGGDQQKKMSMIALNDLTYILPADLSVSVTRTHTNHYFQNNEYSNTQRGICILNSGAHYGDMRLSSLEFGVSFPVRSGGAADDNKVQGYFGKNGSAVNLIERITISSRSGDELVRINQLDLLTYMTTSFKYDAEWCGTVGQAAGYDGLVLPSSHKRATAFFSIPLYMLTDLFAYGRLLPPMILSGLRIEIDWQTPDQAFLQYQSITSKAALSATATKLPSYTIHNPYISMYAVQLTDGVQRALNEMSAVNGLEIVYCDYEPTNVSLPSLTETTTQLEVRKAASRALKAFMITRDTSKIEEAKSDSYASLPWDYNTWQWQLGSLYFPQQPITAKALGSSGNSLDLNTVPQNIIPESYKHTLIAFDRYKADSKRSKCRMRENDDILSYFEHLGLHTDTTTPWEQSADAALDVPASNDGKFGTFSNGASVIGVLLERSDLFNLSGVPINNSRVLSARVNYKSGTAKARTQTIFLKYVRLARVFLNNVEVEQ